MNKDVYTQKVTNSLHNDTKEKQPVPFISMLYMIDS